jgi:hypothetical protein
MGVPLLLALLFAAQQPASGAPQDTGGQLGINPGDLPVSIDRIQRALSQPPAIALTEKAPVFRVEIFGRKPTIEDVLGPKFWVGPVPYGGMTHQDFLDLVTPKEVRPYAGFSSGRLAEVVGLGLLEQWALRSAIHKFQSAKDERAREAARKEVLDALAALEKARREAGLPDK